MFKKIAKKAVAVIMIVTCVAGMAFGVSASSKSDTYTDTVAFTSLNNTSYSSTRTKTGVSSKYTVRITSYSFNNHGSWPSGKNMKLTPMSNSATIGTAITKYSTTYNATESASYTSSYGNQTNLSMKIKVVNNTGKYGYIILKWSWNQYSSL
ncbi:hypothetical protein SAMN02910456_02722 [Ruminococcaceae bacterium YRB3002]|nr:hypothetical protein SAMN02910456_02722 [Ruminococcaceae bacterium YRB3002]